MSMRIENFQVTKLEGNHVMFPCPFCGRTVDTYTPAMHATGKRCYPDCYALFTWPDQLATKWIPTDDDWKVLLK